MDNRKLFKKYLAIAILFVLVFGLSYYTSGSKITGFDEETVSSRNEVSYKGFKETPTGSYLGDFLGGEFAGDGNYYFLTGEIYCGHWENSTMTNDGKMAFDGVGVYEGSYKNSKRSGEGVFYWDCGDSYTGSWYDDEINGEGVFTFKNTSFLEGTFKNNEFIEGVYHVVSEMGELSVSITEGEASDVVLIETKDGDTYEGSFKDGKLNGYGEYTYANGDIYEGEYINNKRAGDGRYTWVSGACYEGRWENDGMSGEGTYYYNEYESYPMIKGSFKDGKPEGECTYYENSYTEYVTKWGKGICKRVEEE